MRNSETRFKSQAVQNLPLTRIKASNLINSEARRDAKELDVYFFLPQVKKVKKKGKQDRKGRQCH